MNLDIRTLFIALHVIVWINACIITLAWYYTKSMRSVIGYWSLSQILFGIGTVLIALRSIIPELISIVIANASLVGGQIAVQEGISRYMNREGYLRKATLGVFFLHVILTVIFTYISPSVSFRIVSYSVAVGLIAAFSIRTLCPKDNVLDAPRKFLIIVLGLSILILIFRSVFAILQGDYTDLMNSGFIQAVGVAGMLWAYTSLSLCLFWLIVHKLGLEVQRQAMTDPLTNALNRRALDELLESQVPVKVNCNIGIIMIDVDNFKEINDQFGHQAGDLYLIELSRVITDNLRDGDAFFRYGGDEFVVVAYNIDYSSLVLVAERLRQKAEELSIPWMNRYNIKTTVSEGLAIADSNTKNGDELMKTADEALYKKKTQRRNRIEPDSLCIS